MQPQIRVCSECRQEKPMNDYAINTKSIGGRLKICKKCHYKKYDCQKSIFERNDYLRFCGNKIKALTRDGFKCVKCSMTNEEHLAKYKCSLSVDHIDGNGRYSKVKNHSLDNLQTLCMSCHGAKDGKIRKSNHNQQTSLEA